MTYLFDNKCLTEIDDMLTLAPESPSNISKMCFQDAINLIVVMNDRLIFGLFYKGL